jgi:hypothetical protein
VTAEFEVESVTLKPPLPAGVESSTVQLSLPPPVTAELVHVSPLNWAGAGAEVTDCALPINVALITPVPGAVVETERVLVAVPAASGLKVTSTGMLWPAAMEAGNAGRPVRLKLWPDTDTWEIVTAFEDVLVMTTCCPELWPTVTFPKLMLLGLISIPPDAEVVLTGIPQPETSSKQRPRIGTHHLERSRALQLPTGIKQQNRSLVLPTGMPPYCTSFSAIILYNF